MRTPCFCVALVVTLGTLGACGGGGAEAGASVPKGLPIAFGAPRLIAMSAHASRAMVVEAVYQASALSGASQLGGVTNTGTIRVTQLGAQYLPEPTDRLVVEWGAQRHEFVVRNAQGNNAAPTAAEWLLSPHVLSYSHALEGQGRVDIDVQFNGTAFSVHTRGTATLGGGSVEVDLTTQGASRGARDPDGQDTTTEYTMTGTLSGDGYTIDVSEQQIARFVAFSSLRRLPSQRGAASSVTTRIASVLHSGGTEIRFDGVRARSDLSEKGGNPKNQNHEVSGRVLRDGALWGECAMAGGMPVLQASDGALQLALQ